MLRPLIASEQVGGDPPTSSTRSVSNAKKASTACLACKHRRIKVCLCSWALETERRPTVSKLGNPLLLTSSRSQCSGGHRCGQCEQRNSQCVYDLAGDQRRKIANQRNIHELAQKTEEVEQYRVLIGGLVAAVRVGNPETVDYVIHTIQNRSSLADLAASVTSIMTSWPLVCREFQLVDFDLDYSPKRPSISNRGTQTEKSTSRVTESRRMEDGLGGEGPGRRPEATGLSSRATHMDEHGELHIDSARDTHMNWQRDTHFYGGTGENDQRRSHGSVGSGSDGGFSIKSNRANRPWELP